MFSILLTDTLVVFPFTFYLSPLSRHTLFLRDANLFCFFFYLARGQNQICAPVSVLFNGFLTFGH